MVDIKLEAGLCFLFLNSPSADSDKLKTLSLFVFKSYFSSGYINTDLLGIVFYIFACKRDLIGYYTKFQGMKSKSELRNLNGGL
jgi:hypothetical protein